MTLEQEIDHISLEKHPIGHLSPFLRSTLVDPQPKNNSCRDPQSKFCGVPIILSYYYDIIYLYYDKQLSPNYCSTLFYRSLLLLWSRYDIWSQSNVILLVISTQSPEILFSARRAILTSNLTSSSYRPLGPQFVSRTSVRQLPHGFPELRQLPSSFDALRTTNLFIIGPTWNSN